MGRRCVRELTILLYQPLADGLVVTLGVIEFTGLIDDLEGIKKLA